MLNNIIIAYAVVSEKSTGYYSEDIFNLYFAILFSLLKYFQGLKQSYLTLINKLNKKDLIGR